MPENLKHKFWIFKIFQYVALINSTISTLQKQNKKWGNYYLSDHVCQSSWQLKFHSYMYCQMHRIQVNRRDSTFQDTFKLASDKNLYFLYTDVIIHSILVLIYFLHPCDNIVNLIIDKKSMSNFWGAKWE